MSTPLSPTDFSTLWKRHHSNTLDLREELPTYYEIFRRIFCILHGALQTDVAVDPEKARMMEETASLLFTLHVEDLAGPNTHRIVQEYFTDCSDVIAWVIAMLRPACTLSEEHRAQLQEEILHSCQQVTSHKLLDWFREGLSSDNFLHYKDVALWFVNCHYLVQSYAEAPFLDVLDALHPLYGDTNEWQQAAQSYVAFSWTFRMDDRDFTIPEMLQRFSPRHTPKVYPWSYYRPVHADSISVDLEDKAGNLHHTLFDLCDTRLRTGRVMHSLLVDFAGNAHFNGPSVWVIARHFRTTLDEQFCDKLVDLEYADNLYPHPAQHKPLYTAEWPQPTKDPMLVYADHLRALYTYYNDITEEDISDCLQVLDTWLTIAEERMDTSPARSFAFACCLFTTFPDYYEDSEMHLFPSIRPRLRPLLARAEEIMVATFTRTFSICASAFIGMFIELNKLPFYKVHKVYNLNRLIKRLRKERE